MTPFEITITILAVLIVLLMGFIAYRVNYFLKDLQADKYRDHQLLRNIDTDVATVVDVLIRQSDFINQRIEHIDEVLSRRYVVGWDASTSETTNNDK